MPPVPCRCNSAVHSPACVLSALHEVRCALFAGLFDDGAIETPTTGARRIHFLDPAYRGDDPVCRRFAQIETD